METPDQEIFQPDIDDRELLELNQVIDLIKSNSIENLSELLKPFKANSGPFGNLNDKGSSMVSGQEDDAQHFGRNKFLSISTTRYSEREKLLSCIREVASALGYATVIKKSKKDRYVRVGCDRGGENRINKLPIKQRDTVIKRTTGTRSIQCPFEIWGRCKSDGFWEMEIKNLTHNHDPSSDMSGHPTHRRFSEYELIRIREMTLSGIAPRQILTSLR